MWLLGCSEQVQTELCNERYCKRYTLSIYLSVQTHAELVIKLYIMYMYMYIHTWYDDCVQDSMP